MQKYKQLTYEQRCQIYALNKSGKGQKDIAILIGVSQSTISRELKRNSGKRGYRFKQAHSLASARRAAKVKTPKMTIENISLIEAKLQEDWSPEQISGWLRVNLNIFISHETIYQYIWLDKKNGGLLFQHLRCAQKKYKKCSKLKDQRGQIKNRISINERPIVVDSKARVGDWEIDTMIGKGHKGALVTIVERKFGYTLAAQVNSKKAEDVTRATINMLLPYKSLVHTITADNGKEFAYHEHIAQALNAKVYFANPYCSWERGLNENTNGLLRQYFPKSTNLKLVTQNEVLAAVEKLNTRPRKRLNYNSPKQLFEQIAA